MRTKKSLLNFITSFLPWILLAIIGFFKIKIFIDNYGSELNGLIQIVGQVYSYLGLLEAGFGAAIIYRMYKPFSENDYEKLNSLFNGSKFVYRIVGMLMFLGGLLVAVIAPFLIKDNSIQRWYISLIFALYAIDYVSIYFWALPYQSLLIADQKKYKLNLVSNSRLILFRTVELFLLTINFNYVAVLIIGILLNFLFNFYLMQVVKKEYPWLNNKTEKDISTLSMTKEVFIHKISKVVFQNTDSILLAMTSTLKNVSIYGAFNYIVGYLEQILVYIFSSATDSFGNLFVDKTVRKDKIQSVFFEFSTIAYYIGIIISTIFYVSANQFVKIWIGDDYQLNTVIVFFFALIIWCQYSLKPVTVFIEATGNYKGTKYIALGSFLFNFLLSFILVNYYGIAGVLFATLLSYALIMIPFNVYYLCHHIIYLPIKVYSKKFIEANILLFLFFILNKNIINIFGFYQSGGYVLWFLNSIIVGIINVLFLTVIFYCCSRSFRLFLERMKYMFKKPENKNRCH